MTSAIREGWRSAARLTKLFLFGTDKADRNRIRRRDIMDDLTHQGRLTELFLFGTDKAAGAGVEAAWRRRARSDLAWRLCREAASVERLSRTWTSV